MPDGEPGSAILTARAARIMEVVATIPDPEIPAVSLLDLGLIRGVEHHDGGDALVITPTYTGCPATAAIHDMVRETLDRAQMSDVAICTVLSPAWTTDWITATGRERLRAYGIAPPEQGAARATLRPTRPAACPRCGSTQTEEVSRFGSTPCKALWRCLTCAEPFDRFKCL